MFYICAQPDETYFHWQIEIMFYNFDRMGISQHSHALFAIKEKPSIQIKNLSKYYNVHWYKDTRTAEEKKYSPGVYPFLVKEFLKEFPEKGKCLFLHDSDIIFRELPQFHNYLHDDICYLSDTISYIGYNYLSECSKRYQKKYPQLPDDHLVKEMCKSIEIPLDVIKKNQNSSGGAQYLMKNTNSDFYKRVQDNCLKLHIFLKNYENKYPIDHHVQSWCASMWGMLWELWKSKKKTKVIKEFDFAWGTSDSKYYTNTKILHMAGVTKKHKKGRFCKGDFVQTNVIHNFKNQPDMFHYVEDNASQFYVEELRRCTQYPSIRPKQNWMNFSLIFCLLVAVSCLFVYLR